MKKLIALVLAVMMVLSCSVIAVGGETATIKFNAPTFTEEGQIGTVEVVAENVGAVTAFQFVLEYDATKLELVSYTVASALEKYIIVNCVVAEEFTVDPGEIVVLWDDTKPAEIDGVMLTFTFKAISDTLGDTYFGFMEGEEFVFYNGDFEETTVGADEESGKIEIDYEHEHVFGDWFVSVENGCENDGEEKRVCTCYNNTCDEYETRVITATGHKDDNHDHICDNGCEVAQGEHSDSPNDDDHLCDYGCGKAIEDCTDADGDGNHNCDVCGKENVTDHAYGEADCENPASCSECGESTGEALGHTGGTATCSELAVCERCQKEYGELDPDYHPYGTYRYDDKEATCTEEGATGNVYCASHLCGKLLEESQVIPALGHTGGTATCSELAVCERCLEEYGIFDYDNHAYGTVLYDAKEATCTEEGYTGDLCCASEDCGFCLEWGEAIPALGHSDSENDGNHNCDVCGEENVTDHTYGGADCYAPATCAECGKTSGEALGHIDVNLDHRCDRACGAYIGTHADSATDNDHVCDYGCGEVLEDCSDADNDKDHNCDVCGKNGITEHKYTSSKVEATCTKNGYTSNVCDECGNFYSSDIVKALGHDYGDWKAVEGKEATCEEGGEEIRTCGRCGETETRTVPKTGHKYGNWETEKEATTTATGIQKRVCGSCGKTEERIIPKVESNYQNPGVTVIESNKKTDSETNPNTGAFVAIGVAALAVMGGAAALIAKKKK